MRIVQINSLAFFRPMAILLTIALCALNSACTQKAISTVQTVKNDNGKVAGGPDYALPKGLVPLRLLRHKTKRNHFGLRLDKVRYIGDDDFRYTLVYRPSVFSSDVVKITKRGGFSDVDGAGLLEKVEFTSDEQSGQVLLKVVELAKEATKATFVPFGPVEYVDETDEDEFDTVLYDGPFDPLSSDDLERINSVLNAHVRNGNISIEVRLHGRDKNLAKSVGTDECRSSICFRRPIVADLILKHNGREFRRINVVLPDQSTIGGIDVVRAALVKEVTTIEFESGMLKSLSVTKPSEALAGLRIPIEVARAIVSIPGEILQLKIDTTKDSTALHNARLGELKAREQLIEFLAKSEEDDLPE